MYKTALRVTAAKREIKDFPKLSSATSLVCKTLGDILLGTIGMKKKITLREYFKIINKNNCPRDCEFNKKDKEIPIEIALVPPPSNEILGILISRDPTVKWMKKYNDIKKECEEESTVRAELFKTAIPESLENRIEKFMGEKISENDKKRLFDIISQKVYWTHLHKCFTDASKKLLKFEPKNGKICANRWLVEELRIVIDNNKIKFIIALGNDVQKWVKEWREKNKDKCEGVEIIELLHTSGQNILIWNRTAVEKIKETEEQINKLVNLCR